MPERPSTLPVICVLWLLNSAIGARVAVNEGLPAEWVADFYVGRDASAEFIKGGGTALSPGLPMMVAQAILAALSTRGGNAGKSGALGLTLLGAGVRSLRVAVRRGGRLGAVHRRSCGRRWSPDPIGRNRARMQPACGRWS